MDEYEDRLEDMQTDRQTGRQAGKQATLLSTGCTCGLTCVVFHGSELTWPKPAGSLRKGTFAWTIPVVVLQQQVWSKPLYH